MHAIRPEDEGVVLPEARKSYSGDFKHVFLLFTPLARGNDPNFFLHLFQMGGSTTKKRGVLFFEKQLTPANHFHQMNTWAFPHLLEPTYMDLSNERNPVCLGCLQDDTTQLYRDDNKPLKGSL